MYAVVYTQIRNCGVGGDIRETKIVSPVCPLCTNEWASSAGKQMCEQRSAQMSGTGIKHRGQVLILVLRSGARLSKPLQIKLVVVINRIGLYSHRDSSTDVRGNTIPLHKF